MHAIDVIRVRRFLSHELGIAQDGIDHWQRHWFAKGFAALEACLAQREITWPYCFGETPGWADLHLIPQVRKGVRRFNLDMSLYPLIDSVFKSCVGLSAFVNARPEQQPDYPGGLMEPEIAKPYSEDAL